jgi:hypothetical protein
MSKVVNDKFDFVNVEERILGMEGEMLTLTRVVMRYNDVAVWAKSKREEGKEQTEKANQGNEAFIPPNM